MPVIAVPEAKVDIGIMDDLEQPGLDGGSLPAEGVQAVKEAHEDFRGDVGGVGRIVAERAGKGEDHRLKAADQFVPGRAFARLAAFDEGEVVEPFGSRTPQGSNRATRRAK